VINSDFFLYLSDLIDHVHNNSTKKLSSINKTQFISNFNKKTSNSKSTSELNSIHQAKLNSSNRSSRYFQHFHSKVSLNHEAVFVPNQTRTSTRSHLNNTINSIKNSLSRSPAFSKKIDLLRNSLSSSRESTPNIVKLSRACTPTPLIQSVSALKKNNSDYYNSSQVKEDGLIDEEQKVKQTQKNTSISADETINSILNETKKASVKVKHSLRMFSDKKKVLNDLNACDTSFLTNGFCEKVDDHQHRNIETNIEENNDSTLINLAPDCEHYSNHRRLSSFDKSHINKGF
jgi:hypothetical protein